MIELYIRDLAAQHHAAAVSDQAAVCAGEHLDPGAAVLEADQRHHMRTGTAVHRLLTFLRGAAVRDGDMTPVLPVNPLHHVTEQASVGRCILAPAYPDEAVNHLVYHGILNLGLGQIEPAAYAYAESVQLQAPVRAAPFAVSAQPEIGAGVAYAQRDRGQLSVKTESVETSEPLLYEFKCSFHTAKILHEREKIVNFALPKESLADEGFCSYRF